MLTEPGWPETVELSITIPPSLEQSYLPDQIRKAVSQELQNQEKLAAEDVRMRGLRVLGSQRVRRLSPYRRAISPEPLVGKNPTFAVGRGQIKMFLQAAVELRGFRRAYRQALAAWRSGLRDVLFPQGTWNMCRMHGAAVHT